MLRNKEVELIHNTIVVNQVLWLKKILFDLNMEEKESAKVFVDNQTAIDISNDPVFHGKTKHFNTKLFYLSEV